MILHLEAVQDISWQGRSRTRRYSTWRGYRISPGRVGVELEDILPGGGTGYLQVGLGQNQKILYLEGYRYLQVRLEQNQKIFYLEGVQDISRYGLEQNQKILYLEGVQDISRQDWIRTRRYYTWRGYMISPGRVGVGLEDIVPGGGTGYLQVGLEQS